MEARHRSSIPTKRTVGGPVEYKLSVHAPPVMLAQGAGYMSAPGAFATKRVRVIRYSPQERHASGKFPNQHAGGDGLPKYIADMSDSA
jgi:primary-amine oxidase